MFAIAAIARAIAAEYNGTIPIISNGNITTPSDVVTALRESAPCCGVMSAEGILANPAIFKDLRPRDIEPSSTTAPHNLPDQEIVPASDALVTKPSPLPRSNAPSLFALFREYCELSVLYQQQGGWVEMDAFYARNDAATAAATGQSEWVRESRQIYIAKQHLAWMLGKSGHGRMVRYTYISACYKKHVHLMQALAESTTIEDLVSIADKCLPH